MTVTAHLIATIALPARDRPGPASRPPRAVRAVGEEYAADPGGWG